jgi:hypothetical protein
MKSRFMKNAIKVGFHIFLSMHTCYFNRDVFNAIYFGLFSGSSSYIIVSVSHMLITIHKRTITQRDIGTYVTCNIVKIDFFFIYC